MSGSEPSDEPVAVLCVYSREDSSHLEDLYMCLKRSWLSYAIGRCGWREIPFDGTWKVETDEWVERAGIILFLVSADLLASDYCQGIEVQRAMERHRAGEAVVMTVLMQPMEITATPFAELDVLPASRIPVSHWLKQHGAWDCIAGEVKHIAWKINARRRIPGRACGVSGTTPANCADLAAGIRDLPQDGVMPLEDFLTEYLGDETHPVPFGGRADALDDLNDWIADPTTPQRLLLTAPAGRGKSALLVRWVESLRRRDDVEVAFYPVSARFRSNLSNLVFAALAARLAVLSGRKPYTNADTPEASQWHSMMKYLWLRSPSPRQLVVVLDGLDEFAGYEPGSDLLPDPLGGGVRVVVAARSGTGEPWLQRLGWEDPELAREIRLGPLEQQGIADVLSRLAFPLNRLAERVDIVAELHRLSEGEALLVRRYVEDLWQRGEQALQLAPEDLATIEPGLAGYFRRWWADRPGFRDRNSTLLARCVRELLHLLAVALGPLERDDLLAVADPATGLDARTLDDALEPLRPFLDGDGETRGYVFRHPRFGHFFQERLSARERRALEQRFIDRGRSVIAGLTSEDGKGIAPDYVVRYHVAHLKRADGEIDAFLQLLENGWRRARLSVDGAHRGYLDDLHEIRSRLDAINAAAAARGEPIPHLIGELRCALWQASVYTLTMKPPASLTVNPPAILPARLVEAGVWQPSQGVEVVGRLPADGRRSEVMVPLAAALAGPSTRLRDTDRYRLFSELLDRVDEMGPGTYARRQALVGLAPHLPTALLDRALVAARAIGDEYNRTLALIGLMPVLADTEGCRVLDEVLAETRAIHDARIRLSFIRCLAPHLPISRQAEVLGEALALARESEIIDEHLELVVRKLAPHLPAALLEQGLSLARRIETPHIRARTLQRIALYLSPVQREAALEEVRMAKAAAAAARKDATAPPRPTTEAARRDSECLDRIWALSNRAVNAPAAERDRLLLEALVVARGINDENRRAHVLDWLAPSSSLALMEEMLTLARTIGDSRRRSEVIASLGRHFPKARRAAVLGEALAAVLIIDDGPAQARALRALASHRTGKHGGGLVAVAESATGGQRMDLPDGVSPLASVIPFPCRGTPASCHRLWRGALTKAAFQARANLLDDLPALVPLIQALGGHRAVTDTGRALQDICRWWP